MPDAAPCTFESVSDPAQNSSMPQPHPHPLTVLTGTWVGSGRGRYPTITDFTYNERVVIARSPKGFFIYQQMTSHPETGYSMHVETGYLRVNETDGIELVIAQPSGVVEIHAGTFVQLPGGDTILNLAPVYVMTSPSAKPVAEVMRSFRLSGDALSYEVHMAAMGLALQFHLAATLHRQP